jgi:K+-transporting ATPase KdpF subunit
MTFQCGKFRHHRYSLKGTPIFMRILYCWPPIPLENLCEKVARYGVPARVPEFDLAQCIGVQADACHMRAQRAPEGEPKCWTSSCWPLALASSRYPSATRWPAISSEGNAMIFDYSLAGLVTAGLLFYLTYALLQPERF